MKVVHIDTDYKLKPEPVKKVKKLPMDKDPVFLAELRRQIIEDHNRKILAKRKNQSNL